MGGSTPEVVEDIRGWFIRSIDDGADMMAFKNWVSLGKQTQVQMI